MESVIKWKTGFPDIEGEYLIIEDNGNVTTDCWCVLEHYQYWAQHRDDEVVAWCPINEIEPYRKQNYEDGSRFNRLYKQE